MKKSVLISLFLFLFFQLSHSQTIENPNFSLKSHETLEIRKITTDSGSTVFFMSIENRRISGGSFCADRNIYIVYPDGTRSKMKASNGIPNCPSSYKFKTVGERLDFTLTFPKLKEGTEWIDLIEDCSENCFSFYGITLDGDLNSKIDGAFAKADSIGGSAGLAGLIKILDETDSKNLGSEGSLYISIITLAQKSGDTGEAKEWYERFKLSGAPRLTQYIKFLSDQGIRY